jgi:hypothetical protein
VEVLQLSDDDPDQPQATSDGEHEAVEDEVSEAVALCTTHGRSFRRWGSHYRPCYFCEASAFLFRSVYE